MKNFSLLLIGLVFLISCQNNEDIDDFKPPIPTNGGQDFLNVNEFMVQLDADSLKTGEFGTWKIFSGEVDNKVSIENKNDPKTVFHGLPGENYQLIWELVSGGKSIIDTVNVSFLPLTTEIAISGREFYQTRMELIAKSYDRGEWTIEGDYHHIWRHMDGGGITIPDENSPAIMFYGFENTTNKITWTTWYGSKSASATIEYNGGTYQQGEALEDLQILDEPYYYKVNENGDVIEIRMVGHPRAWIFGYFEEFPALQGLNNLTKLELKGNGIEFFPEAITSRLHKLKYLDLSHNLIANVSDNIGDLIELDTLILGQNHIESLPESIGDLKELKYLDLYGLKLSSLPESIGNLSNLKYLTLGSNHINKLPESFGKLKSLERFDGPKLSQSIPSSFSNLSNLKICYLWIENEQTVLPEDIGRLSSLTLFNLRGNILRLPESFSNLTNLEVLAVTGGTGISEIPDEIGNLSKLRQLNLTVRTDRLPESFTKLTNLTNLGLYGQLNHLPTDFDKLSNLTGIQVSYLGLKEIPEGIGSLKKLTSFSAAANEISRIPESIGDLSSIHTMYLSRNQITQFPESMAKLSGTLKKLYVNGNKYSNDELTKLKTMLPNTEIITYQAGD